MNTTETNTERFAITVLNPGAVAIEDTLRDGPTWQRRVATFLGPTALAQATAELARIDAMAALNPNERFEPCVAKSRATHQYECGRSLVYRDGWRHVSPAMDRSHWGFPRSEL